MSRFVLVGMLGLLMWHSAPATGWAQQPPSTASTLVAEKRVPRVPPGPLVWRLENFPTRAEAEAAAGPTSLAGESVGKVWLFTLAAPGGSSPGGARVAEVGPITVPQANEYYLRIQHQTNSSASPHTHPGNESMYVLAGEARVQTPTGDLVGTAGQSIVGPPGGTTVNTVAGSGMQVFAMFAVDASQPLTTPVAAIVAAQGASNLPSSGQGGAELLAVLAAGSALAFAGVILRRRAA